jgi:hypothetical protein
MVHHVHGFQDTKGIPGFNFGSGLYQGRRTGTRGGMKNSHHGTGNGHIFTAANRNIRRETQGYGQIGGFRAFPFPGTHLGRLIYRGSFSEDEMYGSIVQIQLVHIPGTKGIN